MPSTSREDYLKQILLLQQRQPGRAVPMGTLAVAMGVAPGSVTGMVKALVEMDLIAYEPYVGVALTPQGQRIATHVLRRHRLIELFLVRTLELDWSDVHGEAEAIEHVVSESLLERIDAYLGRPAVDPHGDPIPDAQGRLDQSRLQTLAEAPAGRRVRVARVLDQDPPFLRFIERVGLKPGAEVAVQEADPHAGVVAVKPRGGTAVNLANDAASKLLVVPV